MNISGTLFGATLFYAVAIGGVILLYFSYTRLHGCQTNKIFILVNAGLCAVLSFFTLLPVTQKCKLDICCFVCHQLKCTKLQMTVPFHPIYNKVNQNKFSITVNFFFMFQSYLIKECLFCAFFSFNLSHKTRCSSVKKQLHGNDITLV